MQMNSGITLAGQQPDLVNVLSQSNQAAQQRIGFDRQNAIANMYQQQGPGIAAGETDALNALARFDPMAAMGVTDTMQIRDIRGQENQRAQTRFNREAEEYARGLSAQQAQAEAAKIEAGVKRAMMAQPPEQFDQIMQASGMTDFVGQFDNRDALAAEFMSWADVLKMRGGGETFRPASPEEASQYGAAGGQIGPDGRFYPVNPPSGFEVVTGPDGRTTVRQGPGAGGKPEADQGPADPSSAIAMVNSIDGILNDPILDNATGMLAFTQAIPGTPMHSFGQRVKQLEGQAFLQAFESLKGGGQITEIEGIKATQAIGRLASTQRPEDFKEALTELRSILSVAAKRPEGWVNQQRQITGAQDLIAPDVVQQMTPEQIRSLGPNDFMRIPISELKGLSDEQWDALEAIAETEQ
jgi:hypothetical protein